MIELPAAKILDSSALSAEIAVAGPGISEGEPIEVQL